jgi:glycerol-3-phosphate cytidylyltransferase
MNPRLTILTGARTLPPRPDRVAEQSARGKVAITYGTYDLFHVGHVNLFRRIKERCDSLVVAVSTDEFNANKGKRSVVPFADRLEIVRACRYVDLAIPETGWDQKERDIVQYGIDLFVMGSDWTGRFDSLKPLCEVLYLPRTEGVSSTELKDQVRSANCCAL